MFFQDIFELIWNPHVLCWILNVIDFNSENFWFEIFSAISIDFLDVQELKNILGSLPKNAQQKLPHFFVVSGWTVFKITFCLISHNPSLFGNHKFRFNHLSGFSGNFFVHDKQMKNGFTGFVKVVKMNICCCVISQFTLNCRCTCLRNWNI